MQSTKQFHFEKTGNDKDDVTELDIVIYEIIDPQYGMFVWPCAPVLARYIFHNPGIVRGKRILELGAGTALPGIVCAKLGAQVVLSDGASYQNCLHNCRKSCEVNDVSTAIEMVPITWGLVTNSVLDLGHIDMIIGSDCFYDKKDFDDILFTVAFILERNPSAIFLTSYQLRSVNDSIEDLLKKWNLSWSEILYNDEDECCYEISQSGEHTSSSAHQIQLFQIWMQPCTSD